MKIRLNKAHFPVTTLGFGRRIGFWFQGCNIRCAGCVSRDTWDADSEREIDLSDVLDWCRSVPTLPDGVTISGGEPFEQPEGLLALLDALAAWRDEMAAGFDILCYSGMPLPRLTRRFGEILLRL